MSNLPPRTGVSAVDRDIQELFDRVRALEAESSAQATLVDDVESCADSGNTVTIGSGALHNVSFQHNGGAALLDYTSPTQPKAKPAFPGSYDVFLFWAVYESINAGGFITSDAQAGGIGVARLTFPGVSPVGVLPAFVSWGVTLPWDQPFSQSFSLIVQNLDSISHTFNLGAIVRRTYLA